MSVGVVTIPRLTKNFAGGSDDTRHSCIGRDGRMVPHRDRPADAILAAQSTRVVSAAAYHRAMLLAVDIGNTNITTGLIRDGAVLATRRAATNPASTADELELLIDGLLRLDEATFADVSSIALASVVPSLSFAIETIAA